MLNVLGAGMKLEFTLLVVDDDPDSITESIYSLEDHLKSKGFSLRQYTAVDFSQKGLSELTRSEGKNYDLVIVDYHLGQDTTDGAIATVQLRRELRYTDMVFYSSDSTIDLLAQLAGQSVEGVFVAERTELGEKLTGLADTVIGKAVDLNHMRGIAMAEVAELDVLMEETLVRVFQACNDKLSDVKEKTIYRLRGVTKGGAKKLEQILREGGLPSVVRDSRLFPSAQKYMAVRRVAKSLSGNLISEMDGTGCYQDDIIKNRNMLAHVKEGTSQDGKTILRSISSNREVIIDDNWMANFRLDLKKHRSALSYVCDAIGRHIDVTDTGDTARQAQ